MEPAELLDAVSGCYGQDGVHAGVAAGVAAD
jgi:hypothetical protein